MSVTDATATVAAGLAFGLSLNVAIGPQNTFILRQGLLRHRVGTVVIICSLSEVLLIVAGVTGVGAVIEGRQHLLLVVRMAGSAFLLVYAALAARRAARPAPVRVELQGEPASRASVVLASLAFTWLNPWVYLDTVVLTGSVANSRHSGHWWFAGGAILAGISWFAGLGFGARLLNSVFTRPRAWQVLDVVVAVVMTVTALRVLSN
ncbi:MAG: LysE/ArgO family amino acid transporter [Acidimicrobiales bacterium]